MDKDESSKSRYQRKIKTREEIAEIIGPFPRKNTVVMCHGVFDIVHPGHLRHLMYAKEKADILIGSVTADSRIEKGTYRPFVPEELRAMNLAAMEAVDYVIIDQNATPLENIEFLKPDYFAKGYEYFQGEIHPRTQEEMEVLESYGGEILFTPGDVVYSSSHLIETSPPKIAAEKLFMLMESERVSFDDLRSALEMMKGLKVHVVGDTIVDSYSHCSMIGGMTKTPTISVKHEHQVDYSGGDAIVAKHIRSAGAEVYFSTVLGDDALKDFVLNDVGKAGIRCYPAVDRTRPTTQKNLILCKGHHLLKVDNVDNRTISDRILKQLKDSLAKCKVDAVVFSDFRHGVFSGKTVAELTRAIPEGVLKVADSQVASRWGNILDFQNFDVIAPNEREARFALGDQDSVVRPLALELYKRANCKLLILKLGERGIMVYRNPGLSFRSFFTVDSFADHVEDAVGSGDALLAYATLALLATKSEVVASILGSFAAAIACEREGNNPVTPEDVLKKMASVERLRDYS